MAVTKSPIVTREAFLAGEGISDVKHQLIDGQMYAMSGSGINHQRICANIIGEFGCHVKGTSCEALSADMLVNVGEDFYYPDVMVVCDFDQTEPYFTQTPLIIVEVLSDSTSRIDRTVKRLAYQSLPSLKEYVLIEQNFISIEVMRKSCDWQGSHYTIGDEVYFESIDLTLSVDEIYERVQNEDMEAFMQKRSIDG